MLRLEDAEARIPKKKIAIILATASPRGKNGKPTKVSEVELELEIKADEILGDLEWSFPGSEEFSKAVASLDHFRGETRTSKAKLGPINLTLSYDGEIVVDLTNCPVKKKPKLDFRTDGEAFFFVSPIVKVTGSELASIAELVEADLRVSLEPTQTDLAETTELANPPAKKPRSTRKKPELELAAGA